MEGGAHSAAVDDYVKAVYKLVESEGTATTSRLALRLGLSASSVSGMARKLADLGLVEHRPYAGLTLTEAGRRHALAMLRRHRLLETFLVQELGYGWDEVHDEAEVLEHYVSETLLSRIDARLGHPEVDPHGDPIPDADGRTVEQDARALSTLEAGRGGRLVRVDDDDPAVLRHLKERGFGLGSEVLMRGRHPFGGSFVVSLGRDDEEHLLGPELAAAMWVTPRE
ncbi:metal-dependent transcriptional regulator [Actinomycetospora termitidis]|uniref:Manganese transport regulator n=1 Tax=Actinomycetospora termitidis TaxID=3053470 RepID=A0ABT7M1W3_9PSEU|nr:metal-dependent transcriptional regulator [Actinomycetospora sp. Odt1-22]MDL5154436.1 metal-dependent transcriptional regulator [Actinomycetospora sp. Odt1-22]